MARSRHSPATDTREVPRYDRLGEEAGRTELQDHRPRGIAASRRLIAEQLAVEVAVRADRRADVARVDGLALFDKPLDSLGLAKLSDELRLRLLTGPAGLVHVTEVDHHPLDEVVKLGQRFTGRVRDERFQRLPLRLSLVPAQTGVFHRA